MTSDVGGLFRSDDGGKHWYMLHGGLPADAASYSIRGLAVHPKDANRILIADGSPWGKAGGIWLSLNGGTSWKRTLEARFDGNGAHRAAGNVVEISPHDSNLVLAGSLGGGIRRSVDGGQTWISCGPDDLSPTHILFDRTNKRRVWLCARAWKDVKQKRVDGTEVGLRGGLFVSEDSGLTWVEINAESPSEMIQDPANTALLIGLRREQQVVRSMDGGRTWARYSNGLAPWAKGDARQDGTYEALSAGPNFVLAGGQGGHFYRLDGNSNTWHEITPQNINENSWWGRIRPGSYRHFGSALGFIGVNPHNPKHWVFTDWYALYQSYDEGQTWNLTIDGVEMVVINTVAQEPSSPQIFHAGMADVGYFRTQDSGQTMEQVEEGISNNIKCVATSPAQPGRIYATGTSDWEWKSNALFISDDAGKTWRRSALRGLPDMKERRCETVAASPSRPNEVWLSVSGAIEPNQGGPWRSLDGGDTWTWQGQGLQGAQGFFRSGYWVSGPELAVSGDGSVVVSSDDHRLLAYRSLNATTWTMLPVPDGAPNCLASDALVPGRFYLATQGGGLWRSDNSGRNWENIVAHDVNWVTADLKVRNRVAAITPQGVLVSTDAGASWRLMGEGLPYRHARNTICFAGENLVVGTGGNGVFYALLSSLQGIAKPMARQAEIKTVSIQEQGQENSILPLVIAPDDSRLRYSGRFETSDPKGPRCAWPASTVEIRFRGTALNAQLSGGDNVRWQIEVDGQPSQKIKVGYGNHRYRIADGLTPGEHTVRLVQATEAIFGTTQLLGFELSEGGELLPVAARKHRLEVIGDSISAGYGNEAKSKEEHFSPNTQNAYFTYGAIAARALNADYTCIAWSGKKMWPNNTLPEIYNRTLPTDERSQWDFSRALPPDSVVINLATNDFAGGIPEENGWVAGYKTFIARVHKNYPNAKIYCAIGTMMGDWGPGDKPLSTLRRFLARVVSETRAETQASIQVIDFGTQDGNLGYGADWHPNIANHERMAIQLAQSLREHR